MKKRITTYTFDASEKTITFGFAPEIEGFSVITNVVDNVIIYQFNDPALGGSVTGNVLTLTYNTASMSDTDELMILYDDGVETQAVSGSLTVDLGANNDVTVTSGTVTANAGTNLNTSALALEAGGNLAAIKTNTDDIETLLTTIEGNQLADGHNVTVDNVSLDVDTGLTQPLTDTELRATPVPVSGTVTANLSATDNAVLDDIASDTEAIKGSLATAGGLVVNLGANNDVTVTGSVTADLGANNDVTVTSGAITETNSGAIKTAVEKIDDAIAGSEMQVDVVSMPTTTVQATNLDIRDLSQTTDGVAIYGSDDGGTTKRLIKTDAGGAIQVDLEVSSVTVDNVTIDNEGGASAVNIQDGGNVITVDGTVTANLSATDNAVLDTIDSVLDEIKIDTEAIETAVEAIQAGQLADGHNVTVDNASLTVDLGANNDVTITSGTVTANAGTNLNTSALALETGGNLAAIKAKTDNIPALGQALASASVPVILPAATITTLTPPAAITGFATSAKQDTIIGHVDGIETVLGTIDTDTGNIVTSVQLLDNAVDGNYLNTNMNIAGTDVAGGNGTTSAQTQRVTISSDSTGQVKLAAGTAAIGKLAANSGVDIGDVDVLSLPDSGQSIFRSIDLDESEEAVKATAGTLYGWYLYNNSSATLYMKLYNATVANVTVGTTTPVMTVPVPAGSAANVSFNGGITFGTAITAAVTTGVADNNTGAPAANDFIANIFYK